ncbi:putative ubiquitin carrier protein [Astrocystis sublimbata]|nr:putative ubiquitin carrier protein [Astrocystis sublimbata]
MSSSRARRVGKELADIANDDNPHISVEPVSQSDMTHLRATIIGPPGTPYEGGQYIVDITVPHDYPFCPPTMKFVTKVWHPNISSQTGAICIDTLSTAWSPVLTLKSTLLSLQSLFESPEPRDPQDAEVATMMLRDPEGFAKQAHEWAVRYANAPRSERYMHVAPRTNVVAPSQPRDDSAYQGYNRALVDKFVELGFPVERVVEAFEHCHIPKYNGQYVPIEQDIGSDIADRLFGDH